ALLCCQAFSLACVDLGLPNPLAQRLQGNSEILGDHFHGFAALTHETNGLGTKLRWVWSMRSRHAWTSLMDISLIPVSCVHQTGSSSPTSPPPPSLTPLALPALPAPTPPPGPSPPASPAPSMNMNAACSVTSNHGSSKRVHTWRVGRV